jgi:predicted branched-subunit amino acid permease
MNIFRSKYVQLLLLTDCQIVTFMVVYDAFWSFYRFLKPNFRRDIAWGLTLDFALMIFVVISLVGAIVGNLLFVKHQLLMQCFCLLSFACFFLGSWSYLPYRTSLLLVCAIVGFLGPFLLLRKGFTLLTRPS